MLRSRLVLVAVLGLGVLATLVGGELVVGHVAGTDVQKCSDPSVSMRVSPDSTAAPTDSTMHVTLGYTPEGGLSMTSTTEISTPITSPYAKNLLSAPGSAAYRQTMSCLLETYYDDVDDPRAQSRRDQPPAVRIDRGKVVVTDTASDVLSARSGGYVGTAGRAVAGLDDDVLTVVAYRSTEASCSSLIVDAPPGWLADPYPWPPTSADATSMTWAPCSARTVVTLHPGLRSDVILAATQNGSAALAWTLSYLCYPLLALAAVLLVRRILRAVPPAAPPGSGPGTDRREASLPVADLLVPVVVISTALLVLGVVGNTVNLPAEVLTLIQGVLVAVAVVWSAWRWRLDRPVVLATTAGIAAALVVILVLLTSAPDSSPDAGTAPRLIDCWGVVLFLVVTLLVAGGLNALRLLRPGTTGAPRSLSRGQAWCWGVGLVVATAVVIERYRNGIDTTSGFFTVAPSLPVTALVPPFSGAMISIVLDAINLLACLLPLGVVRAVFWRGDLARPADRFAVLGSAAALLIYAEQWTVSAWSWTVPTFLVLAPLTVLVVFGLRSVRDREETGAIHRYVESRTLDDLRDSVRRWRAGLNEGRRLEADLAGGQTGLDEHDRRATQLTDQDERIVARGSHYGSPNRYYTPIDLVLIAGPGGSPTGNARQMGSLALGAGILVNLGLVVAQALTQQLLQGYQVFTSPTFFYTDVLTTGVMTWAMTGFSVGLLWRYLPGRRGPTRVLLPLSLISVSFLVGPLINAVLDEKIAVLPLIQLGLLWASMMVIAVVMDVRALHPSAHFWSTRRSALATAYGTQHLAAQTAFVLAQVSAIIAIITFAMNISGPPPTSTAPPTPSSSTTQR